MTISRDIFQNLDEIFLKNFIQFSSFQAGKGILRSVNITEQAVADMIPVDLPVNMIVAAAWYTAVHKPKDVVIYHSTTGALNPHTWGEMSKY